MSTELKIIGPEDLQGASLVLATNKGYVAAYQKKAAVLLKKAKECGGKLTPELDAEINKYLVSNKTCLKKMEEDRKPFTSKLQEVVGLFTAEENYLKNDLYKPLQEIRDASAKAWAEEEKKQAAADQLKLDQEKERITLFAEAEAQIRTGYANQLANDKGELICIAFEGSDAATIDQIEELLKDATGTYTEDMFSSIDVNMGIQYLTSGEAGEIIEKAKVGKLEKIQPHYASEIRNYCDHLLTLIPDRRKEIEAGEESKAAAALRETEAAQLAKQAKQAEAQQQATVSTGIANAVMDININQTARTSMMPAAKAIESYSITVTKREGWAEIFKFYFTHSDEVELGKIKLDQMKTFAERLAKSQNIKIESDAIVYEAKYKAVAKKVA